jgi:hypothetical protein
VPWIDIAEAAGVELPSSIHYRTIQQRYKKDKGIINAVCEEEKELTRTQADNRLDFIDIQLLQRPHSKDWEDVAFCDEFHFGIGLQITKYIKRCKGSASRYKRCNCWKDSYSPAVVVNHVDRPGYMLFRPASLKGFCPDCRIITLVNTSTVTITLCYRVSF